MNEITKKIEELRDEVYRLNVEIRELEKQNSNYYIGVYEVGDGDYWDEYYCRLGFISETEASVWVDKQYRGDNVYNARYFEVSEEIYNKYGDWCALEKLKQDINTYNKAIKELEGVYDFEKMVNKAIDNLAKEIGIKYLSFMHPDLDNY